MKMKRGPYTKNLINAITEGLLGYLIYLSRTGMQEAYSEYLLYDPIIRIAKDKGWEIKSEYPTDNKTTSGDKKRIDFLFKSSNDQSKVIGLEVKYIKTENKMIDFKKDSIKLEELKNHVKYKSLEGFILIAGRLSRESIKTILNKNRAHLMSENVYTESYFKSQFIKNYGVATCQVIVL